MDGIILGRAAFNAISGFDIWPYTKPVIVQSTRLQGGGLPDGVGLARSAPEARAQAARQGWKRAYIDGGAAIRSFLMDGAICDAALSKVLILLGEGTPLFERLGVEIRLRHLRTRMFPSGLVQSQYEVLPPNAVD